MRFSQSKHVYIFLALLINIPTFIIIFIIVDRGWAGFLESEMHEALPIIFVTTVIVLLFADKTLELNNDNVTIHHAKIFKKVIKLDDILFVRLGKSTVRNIPISFLIFHTRHDPEKQDDVIGKRAKVVDLNFSKEDQEKIYQYFEEKGLLATRQRFEYLVS